MTVVVPHPPRKGKKTDTPTFTPILEEEDWHSDFYSNTQLSPYSLNTNLCRDPPLDF
jgi:hypothetical protein